MLVQASCRVQHAASAHSHNTRACPLHLSPQYFRGYVDEVCKAVASGVKLTHYYVWSFTDNVSGSLWDARWHAPASNALLPLSSCVQSTRARTSPPLAQSRDPCLSTCHPLPQWEW